MGVFDHLNVVCRQRRVDLSANDRAGRGCSCRVDRFAKVPSASVTNGLSRLTWIAPIPSPAKAPELSAKVIGTWVGQHDRRSAKEVGCGSTTLVGADGAEVKAAFARLQQR